MKAFFITVLMLMGGMVFSAQALDVQVEVSEQGKDATDARIKAMTSAETLAFTKVLKEKAPKKADELLKSYDAEAISQMVQGYEIVEESMSPNSYTATMKVKFNETAMNQLFGANIPKAGKAGLKANGAVLIIPVYFGIENQVLLWETGNQWRDMVNKIALQAKSGNWIAPLGDPTDLMVADSNSILDSNFAKLTPIAERYGAGEVLVAIAKPADNMVAVEMRHLSAKGAETQNFVIEAPQDIVAKEADLLQQAAEKMLLGNVVSQKGAMDVEEPLALTSTQKQLSPAKPKLHQINVVFYLKQARDWAEMNHRLISIEGMEGVQPLSADWHHMNAVLSYRGFPEELGQALAGAGIDVRQEEDVLMMKIR